ncbi:MAG: PAS domain S-box protein [Syntrophorhabdales bacterium]
MRLRTQFILTMLLFGAILVVVAASAIVTSQQIEKVARQERIAAHIAEGAGELTYLSNDYLIYGENQQLKRWHSRFDAFSTEVAALRAGRPEQQALVANIRANQNRMKEVFASAASAMENPSRKVDLAFLHLSWSRMAVQSQGLVSDATRLSSLLRQQMDQLTKERTTLMYVTVGLFGLFLLAGYMLTYRRILQSIGALRTGAAVIGSGNLDFMIEEGKDDEIGDLSRAFNRMTVDLKTVTASKTDLEREIVEREKAQIALRISEERWATTLASIGDAVIATDTNGGITFMNAVAETLTGWTLADAALKPVPKVFNIINEQTRSEVESPVIKVLREGTVVGLANHTILVRKDGTEVPIDDSGAPIRDSNGNTTGVVLVFRDITERRRAEAALAQARVEAELRMTELEAVLEVAPATIWIAHDPQCLRITGNRYADEIMKVPHGANTSATAPPGDATVTWRMFRNGMEMKPEELPGQVAAATGKPVAPEMVELVFFDGHVVTLVLGAVPLFDADGRVRGSVIAGADVTLLRKAEEELRESEATYRNLFENMTEEVHFWKLVRDEEGRIKTWRLVDANPPTLKTWGKTLDEIKGKPTDEIFGPGATDHYLPVVQKIVTEGVPHSFEDYFPNLDKYFRFTSVPFGDFFITTGADITSQKRIEETLRKSRDELDMRVKERTTELQQAFDRLKEETEERQQIEAQLRQAQKMEALGTMSGGIAHDFNNILAAIIGFAELLEGHVAKGGRDARHLHRIMEAGIRGRELVRQMLAFSRKTEQEKKPLAVSSIVKETVKLLRATTPSTISVTVNASTEALILADPTPIQQVLMNLCTNAVYAMQEKGGSLDIELSDFSASLSNGDPHGIAPGRYVKLSVRDTGTGMSADIVDKIFDPFFTTKKVGEGTGLGLSVVHGIVKQHDGYITVQSEPGRGSTFTVYFPQIMGGAEAEALRDDEIPTGSERILFVDDEEALVEMGEDILAELGYEVTSRMNGREALKLLKLDPSRFDLVITDQTMPEMAGVELAKEILAIRADMPIIVCTGFSYVVDADKARGAGIKAFAMKPLTKREIARTVRKALDE